jgi:hypothetical protein
VASQEAVETIFGMVKRGLSTQLSRQAVTNRTVRYRPWPLEVASPLKVARFAYSPPTRLQMKQITWRTDEHGRILGPAVHDGTFRAIHIEDASRLRLDILRAPGDVVSVQLFGLSEYNIVELWNGAIVSELFAWKAGSVPETSWVSQDSAWNVLFRDRFAPHDVRRAAQEIAARRPEPWLFQLACSYGGVTSAVCQDIKVFDAFAAQDGWSTS